MQTFTVHQTRLRMLRSIQRYNGLDAFRLVFKKQKQKNKLQKALKEVLYNFLGMRLSFPQIVHRFGLDSPEFANTDTIIASGLASTSSSGLLMQYNTVPSCGQQPSSDIMVDGIDEMDKQILVGILVGTFCSLLSTRVGSIFYNSSTKSSPFFQV